MLCFHLKVSIKHRCGGFALLINQIFHLDAEFFLIRVTAPGRISNLRLQFILREICEATDATALFCYRVFTVRE